MNKGIAIAAIVVTGLIGLGVWFASTGAPDGPSRGQIVVHKTPTCGCCGVFATYMKQEGYGVEIDNMNDLTGLKRQLGVPEALWSCHTSEIAGYVVEGHIPEEAIAKLLEEKPDIKGIGMAGMPVGSPGMPGQKSEPFVIYKIMNDGTQGDVFMTI